MNAIYSHDWFTRNSNYTTTDDSKKLGWEETVKDAYSNFLYNHTIVNTLVNNNVELQKEFENILESFEVMRNVSCTVDKYGKNSWTNGKKIVIGSTVTEKLKNDFKKMDVLLGLLFHEASHCLYSDFIYLKYHKSHSKFQHWIQNVIEDEMIETKLGLAKPGYINFIATLKKHMFDEPSELLVSLNSLNKLDQISKLFFFIIRYPKYITKVNPAILDMYADLFIEIKDILENNHCLDASTNYSITQSSSQAAKEIYDAMHRWIDAHKEEERIKETDTTEAPTDVPTEDSDNASDNDDSDDDNFDEEEDEDYTPILDEEPETFDEMEKEMDDDCRSVIYVVEENNNTSSISESLDEKKYQKEMNDIINTNEKDNENSSISTGCGVSTLGNSMKRDNNVTTYNTIFTEINKYIPLAKNIIVNNTCKEVYRTERFLRNGTLDSSRLAVAMQNISTVYTQKRLSTEVKNDAKFALVLMLDESGSMRSKNIDLITTKLAILFYEALSQYPGIDIFIYGHGDSVNTYIDHYRRDKYILGNRDSQCDQNETLSYPYIINEVKKQTNLPIVAINITDSGYCCNTDNLIKIMKDYQKSGVNFNLISLNEYYRGTDDINKTIYGEGGYITTTPEKINEVPNGMSDLIKNFAKIVKKNFDKFNRK